MPVPKRKRSKSRRDKRHANWGIKVKAITECQNCKHPLPTHQACAECGHYKGVKVLVTKEDRAQKRGEVRKVQSEKRAARMAAEQPAEAEQK